ncbi:FAD-dependent oxidoreductase [Krasilnikovia sp. MM14-A1004]|uniref:FAD-dependent oxidoreductase n=1 Tax=Krasilnikovia sp. MM14-A1004 TaxID=3373541 RepID=UPI00399C54E3
MVDLTADVLVAGGGPAGAWAALKAARAGADVILVDKGYTGTSGATAAAGTGVWYVEPEPAAREAAMASREHLNGHLSDRHWMARVLDQTYANVHELATTGRYPFPVLADGSELRRGVQGPEYMRRMRAWLKRSGVRILDHSPVLELLTDPTGAVAGAAGHRRQLDQPYRVRAGAVVLATGGCAFLSRALGCDVNTGDGALFAAEVGAALSGMEFSNAYAIAPEFSSVTKTAYYNYATFYHEDGTVLDGAASQRGRSVIARALLNERVFARLDLADETVQAAMRRGQPNFFLPFDRMRINPFTDLFPITLLLEGTVRGTGGVRVVDEDCATGVPGLYVAGDVATRELICGGFTGGGSHNSAWAMSSGTWAGTAAARHAAALGPAARHRRLVPAGRAGLRPTGAVTDDHRWVVRAVQAETHPYVKNYLRRGDVLDQALATLDDLWADTRAHLRGSPVESRQAAAMVAHARWMYTAALARTESRGMHKRLDRPETDPAQRHRLTVGGLDELWTSPDPVRPHTPLDLAVAS